ncbi:MAG: ZmpA/ZmpB/ZmpC family metallo-endopeptidase-related protein, partial [Bacillota bacterium]
TEGSSSPENNTSPDSDLDVTSTKAPASESDDNPAEEFSPVQSNEEQPDDESAPGVDGDCYVVELDVLDIANVDTAIDLRFTFSEVGDSNIGEIDIDIPDGFTYVDNGITINDIYATDWAGSYNGDNTVNVSRNSGVDAIFKDYDPISILFSVTTPASAGDGHEFTTTVKDANGDNNNMDGSSSQPLINVRNGSESLPFEIGNAYQLDDVRSYLGEDKHFIQTADIDLGVDRWADGEGWEPLGNSSTSFSGSFDGNGYTIYNLTVNRPTTQYQGLFGHTAGAEISNMILADVNMHGYSYTGPLAGYTQSSSLENLHVTGEISGSRDYTGGLVGYLSGGNVHYCSFNGSVSGLGGYTGGLVGYAPGSPKIYHSYSLGSVTGNDRVGGLIGLLQDNSAVLSDCYSQASVSGAKETGGLVGYLSSGRIVRSFSTGLVSAPDGASDIGGLLGKKVGGSVNFCYWDTESSGQLSSAAGTGKSTTEMQQRTNYENWNFYTLWQINEGSNYPVFQDLSAYAVQQAVTLADLEGEGTAGNPYIISNADQLAAMQENLTAYYQLGNDIDLSATVAWNYGLGWEPIGDYSNMFSGSFDGNGYTIHNLTINRPGVSRQGFFGGTSGATVSNVTLASVSIQSSSDTGAMVGYAYVSNIDNVHITGEVTGLGDQTGGVVGYFMDGRIDYSTFNGTVIGLGGYTGGLAGRATNNADIYYSYSLGSVAGKDKVGGLIGLVQDKNTVVSDCYSRASVSGLREIGGLVGYFKSKTYRSYSTGLVSAPEGAPSVGGLLGYKSGGSAVAVEGCYWDTQNSGQATSAGGSGKTTAEMQQQITFIGWDFTGDPAVWSIVEGTDYPNLVQTTRSIALIPAVQFHGAGGVIGNSFQIISNTDWSAASNQDWLIIDDGSAGSNNGEVIYQLEANPSTDPRKGIITVSSSGIERTFTINQLGVVLVSYTVTYTAGEGGLINGQAQIVEQVTHGSDGPSVNAEPDITNGYEFTGWSDGLKTAERQDTNITSSLSIEAYFALRQYEITVSADPEAGGIVTGGGTYSHGQQVIVTATANAGYQFDSWIENSENMSADGSYTFTVTASRNLIASFNKENESSTPDPGPPVYYGFSSYPYTFSLFSLSHFPPMTLRGSPGSLFSSSPLIDPRFVRIGGTEEMAAAKEAYEQLRQAFEANKDSLSAREYARQQVELAVALAAIRALEATLAAQAGQDYDLSAAISAYRTALNLVTANGNQLTGYEKAYALLILRTISEAINAFGGHIS